jgi:hypothetical protein
MTRLINGKSYVGIGLMLLAALVLGPGCEKAKPPLSPQAAAFAKDVQAMINRVAQPLIEPVSREDRGAAQKALEKAFSVCAEACEGMFYNVLILDHQGVLTAIHPPAEVKHLQFSSYKAVQQAFTQKKPNQAILYQPDGTPIDIVFVPLIREDKVVGILALGFEGNLVRDKRGLGTEEFLSLDFQSPGMKQ